MTKLGPYLTLYRDDWVALELTELDDTVTLVCVNDACEGLEQINADGSLCGVRRIGFDGVWHGPARVGGIDEPGYFGRDYCPVCGQGEVEAP